MLSSRQERILGKVVEDYVLTGQPVASRTIATDPNLDCSPSTVRNELAALSMGMSADFEKAIRFGATHVRVGSAIFGARGASQ